MLGIYYFSGTGNTKAVAELLHKGIESRLYSIEEVYDLEETLMIMFPVHAFGPPKNVVNFVTGLPVASSKIMIIKTAGDVSKINSQSSKVLVEILKKKGYQVVYDRSIVMPSNFFMGYPKEVNHLLYKTARIKVADIIDDIKLNKTRLYDSSSLIFKMTHMINQAETKYGCKQFSHSLRINDKCNKCMICHKNCPVDNIDSELNFHDTCIMCMRCIYKCPLDAIYSKGMQFCILKEGYHIDDVINGSYDNDDFKLKGYYKRFSHYIEDKKL